MQSEKKKPLIEAKSEEKFMIFGVGERARLGRKAFVVMNGPFCFDVRSISIEYKVYE